MTGTSLSPLFCYQGIHAIRADRRGEIGAVLTVSHTEEKKRMKIYIQLTLWLSVLLAIPFGAFAQLQITESTDESFAIQCNATLYPTGTGQHQWGSSYANWNSPTQGRRIEQSIMILEIAPASYWTLNYSLTGSSGGYIGLQTDTDPVSKRPVKPDGSLFTRARFSLWNAVASRGTKCRTFGGEGVGRTCQLEPFPITLGTQYTIAVERQNTEADGTWWQGSVINEDTGTTTPIGSIKTKHSGSERLVRATSNFSEYYGAKAANCNSVPRTIVSWLAPLTTPETGDQVDSQLREFTKAPPPHLRSTLTCDQAGVQASGQQLTVDGERFYRMTNGSISMCTGFPIPGEVDTGDDLETCPPGNELVDGQCWPAAPDEDGEVEEDEEDEEEEL